MKAKEEVVSDFNELVNMSASELESWLQSDDSNSAGWPKADGSGESVGHDSGRKIVEILKSNPSKEPGNYGDEQVEHMRKVVAYCKRHLAQEEAVNKTKTAAELKKTKSYASLKNWGHDFLKGRDKNTSEQEQTSEANAEGHDNRQKQNVEARGPETREDHDGSGDGEGDILKEDQQGTKRKAAERDDGPYKKRETRKGGSKGEDKASDSRQKEETDDEDSKDFEEDGDADNASTTDAPSEGDTVSWKWGRGKPSGKVVEVNEEKTSITTKNGNEVARDGKPGDPAVVLDTGKTKVIKLAHELD
ncbi:DNA-binding protein [Pleurostoma richardsiae]|uniref:DNA-binding protein n=1 Tax=Pleurostoma richardsiae TaxID=41990 RepID=A0AA38VL37_9PEZI|nr:DNA-binding protein [Pleurostoma richardsiae]